MAYVPKRINIATLLLKEETTFGTEATPSASTDGMLLAMAGNTPNWMPDEVEFDGNLGDNSAGLQGFEYAPPAGRTVSINAPMYFRGYGSAYSASNVPPNGFHVGMKACGYGVTVVTTGGSESITYTPHGDSTTPTSLTGYGWGRQVLGASNLVR